MARNANWDKAKRQAVGIYRAASPHASINHGVAMYSGGDYRAPEGTKLCYLGKPEPFDSSQVNPERIKRLPPGPRLGARKRSNSCPQERGTLTASGVRSASPAMRAVVGWDSYATGESQLIKRAM